MFTKAALFLAVVPMAFAKTDLTGCTTTVNGPVVTWYVPGTGEICAALDCGGGRAPPKTTVPGCAAYVGTATYSPSYLPGYGAGGQAPPASTPNAPASSAPAAVSAAASGSAAASAPAYSVTGSAAVSTITPIVTLSSARPTNGTSVRFPSASSVLTQSTNAGNLVGAPVVGGLLLGAAALIL